MRTNSRAAAIPLLRLTEEQAAGAGRKAADLAALARAGFPVPEGWVIPAGDHVRAREHLTESLRRFAEVGHWNGLAAALEGFAGLAMVHADALRAMRLCGAAAALRERLASPLQDGWRELLTSAILGPARSAAGARAEEAWARGARLTVEEAVSYAPEWDDC